MDEQVKYTAATYGDATEPGCGSGRRLTASRRGSGSVAAARAASPGRLLVRLTAFNQQHPGALLS
jgi:hypothetical protein